MIILKFKIEFVPRDKIGYELKKKQTSTPKMTVIDNLTISRLRSTQLTTESHWRVILNQKRTRDQREYQTKERKKAQNDENKPAKVYKPFKPQAKNQKH